MYHTKNELTTLVLTALASTLALALAFALAIKLGVFAKVVNFLGEKRVFARLEILVENRLSAGVNIYISANNAPHLPSNVNSALGVTEHIVNDFYCRPPVMSLRDM